MSELIKKSDNRATIHWKLLASASALALTAYSSSIDVARAKDVDRPQVWIELGGQLNRLDGGQETFAPSIFDDHPTIFSPSQKFERPPLYSVDKFGQISFQPENSDWIFTASIQYGRSGSDKHVHQQTYPVVAHFPSATIQRTQTPRAARFADTRANNSEQHDILDFSAGKDVGLGLLGSGNGSSTLSLGVRFAQFHSKSNVTLNSDPDWHFAPKYFVSYYYSQRFKFIIQPYHSNAADLRAERSFRGVGPSLSWKSSIPFAGSAGDAQLMLDWGLNAAMLFGRQKTRTQHQTTARYDNGGTGVVNHGHLVTIYHHAPPASTRMRNVTVPNVGGFASISFHYSQARISLGYRADFFFGAIDGGIDAAKKEKRGFFGPYASLSIGLGD